MKKYLLVGVIVLSVILSACKAEPAALTVMTHDSFVVSDAVIAQFEKENNVKVNFPVKRRRGQRTEPRHPFKGCAYSRRALRGR